MAHAHDVKRYPGSRLFTALFFVYLYLPIAVVAFYSFNDNKLVSVWTGFSLRWYESALHNRNLLSSVKISLRRRRLLPFWRPLSPLWRHWF